MIAMGAFFVLTGNLLPKTFTPLSALQCDGAKTQAFLRFAGRTWVLLGAALAMAWMTLPLDVARLASFVLVLGTLLAVALYTRRLRRARPREA